MRKWIKSTAVAAIGLSMSLGAFAQGAPGTLTIVVPYSAGGASDSIVRSIGQTITRKHQVPVVVDNKPGGGSNIATDLVREAAPDGYTLLMMAVTSTINQTLYKNVKFKLERDFDGVVLCTKVPNILVVNPTVPAKTVKELIDWARANEGKVSYASSGSGTSIHMAGELFKLRTGLKTLHVPYKGSAPALTDLIGGQVQYMFDNMPSAWPHVQGGKLRALAVTTRQRSPSAPDVPTMEESGVSPFDVTSWFGLVAPKGTPKAVQDRINQVVNAAFDKPEIKQAYAKLGAIAEKNSPQDFSRFIHDEVNSWAPVVKASGAQVD